MKRLSRVLTLSFLTTVTGALVLVGTGTASAVTSTAWADWGAFEGEAGAFTTSMALAVGGFPSAQVSSDSRAGQVGVISGASRWLSEGTPIGAKYGSSRDLPYLNLRPVADSDESPSTTTYSFDTPTPHSGWAFALGDIDADQVSVSAVSSTGDALTAAELGFQGGFNYCAAGVTGKPSCTGAADDIVTWDPATFTATGNSAGSDTSGAAGWFEPTVAISQLTFVYTQRVGFPVYQTWFAGLARDISGAVRDADGVAVSGTTVNLIDQNGAPVGSTVSDEDGNYDFPGYTATDGYIVEVVPSAGQVAEGESRLPVDLTETDAVNVDFVVRAQLPVTAGGTVTDEVGKPIADVTVILGGGDEQESTTTDEAGEYLFDLVPPGDHSLSIEVPDGYLIAVAPEPFTVPEDSETPLVDQDFVLEAVPGGDGEGPGNGGEDPGAGVVPPGGSGPQLAKTGVESGGLLALAALLGTAGVLLLRRRLA